MITNLNYLRTALEAIESGTLDEATLVKILRTVAFIAESNADRIDQQILDRDQAEDLTDRR